MALRNICSRELTYVCNLAHCKRNAGRNLIDISLVKHTTKFSSRENSRGFKRLRDSISKRSEFTQKETPFKGVKIETGPLHMSKLWKPLGFTIAFSTATFAGAAIWQYEMYRKKAATEIQDRIGWIKQSIFPKPQRKKVPTWRSQVQDWWLNLTEAQRLFVPICFVNVVVFAMWRVPRLQPYMVKYFCSNPASRAVCWPMVLSTFSHYSLFHMCANLYVLNSFSSGAMAVLSTEEFIGLYFSAGVISSLFSYVVKTGWQQAGLSLGASGAIMGIIGFVCTQFPDTTLSIIFLPSVQFTALTGLKFLVGIDLAGVIMGWKFFDHAAHLGGAVSGVFWSLWGHTYIWQNRIPLLQVWNKLCHGENADK